MNDEPTPNTAASRSAFLWVGAVMLVVIVATATAFLGVVLFGNDADPPASEEPTATVAIAVAVRELALRSAPDGAAAIVARLNTGDAVEITGRDATGDWLIVHPEGNPATEGWVPVDGIDPLPPLDQIPITIALAAPDVTASVTPTGAPTFTPDLPDLVIEAVFARDNRLTVVIANIGIVDAIGAIFVSVDGGTPIPADVKPGEPLRPNDQLEVTLETEYVQRRASVSVAVSTDPAIDEESLENNARETVVTPDRPNDLAIASVTVEGPDASLRVTIRNNSPIPITGSVTISARESSGDFTELGTLQPFFTLAPGETFDVDFPDTSEVALENVQVLMTTTAINDTDFGNDTFPQ
ncbi:MAG: SH3 domain-containing protein [Dehalococcoidia bacterium]|jgi:hypothetical protein|nr:SH3 domain-containing protein [Dehalococcoidia bacterium]